MEVIRSPPDTSAYVPLSEHQSATPASFYNGPPVLHYHSRRSKVVITAADLGYSAPLATFASAYTSSSTASTTTNGHAETEDTVDGDQADPVISDAEIWVSSEKFIIYSATASTGLTIPYPSISLHAIQSLPHDEGQQGLYMQLVSSQGGDAEGAEEDDDMESVSLTIIPSPSPVDSDAPAEAVAEAQNTEDNPTPTEATMLFNALSACSNLHPDPVNEEGDMDLEESSLFQAGLISAGNSAGGLPPPMPGSGGWITAENIHEFVDADGNFIGGNEEDDEDGAMDEDATTEAPLGPGAGSVRPRDGDEAEGAQEIDETKWRRTD